MQKKRTKMRVLGESWCFCNGGGKSEKMKGGIFSGKSPAMARISDGGTGFLIHRNLLLTTHANLPSVAAAEAAEIRLYNGLSASLFPQRFYITSSVLDLTMVGLDVLDGDTNAPVLQPHYLKTCSKPNLELGSVVYLLGYTEKQELTVGEGKVVIATDNLIKLSTDGITWSPGSAGFDIHGNLAFMVCDPMKLATSPTTKSSSTSSSTSSLKRDTPMQFGIPIPVICSWLNQHWEGNLDELNKPKLPLIRLVSSGPRSEHSCASFTMRRVFKSTEEENDGTPTSSNMLIRPVEEQPPPIPPVINTSENETLSSDPQSATHAQGIPTPEIYESPMLTSGPVKKNEVGPIQLLDINFPPRVSKPAISPQPSRNKLPKSNQNYMKGLLMQQLGERDRGPSGRMADVESTGSVNGAHSEVHSSASPIEITEVPHEYSSEGETTMYSAETAESRNYTSPREDNFYQVGRSKSCVNYNNRWGPVQRTPIARGAMLEKHRSFTQGRKVYSQGGSSQRSNDYFSPTVSSIMRKRNNMDPKPRSRPRQSNVHSSPKWNF